MKKAQKYNNKKTVVDGITFDSDMEARYYAHLMSLKLKGEIERFQLQPVFELQPAFKKRGLNFRAITYKADFQVFFPDGSTHVIDVKGMETADFKIKKKMFEYKFREYELKLITFSKIDGGWIELADLKEARKKRKLEKENNNG